MEIVLTKVELNYVVRITSKYFVFKTNYGSWKSTVDYATANNPERHICVTFCVKLGKLATKNFRNG